MVAVKPDVSAVSEQAQLEEALEEREALCRWCSGEPLSKVIGTEAPMCDQCLEDGLNQLFGKD